MKAILLIVSFMLWASAAHATVVNPSGGDDTAAIQKVCNAGQVVELVKGHYNWSSVTCSYITGKVPANECYFWYEGVVCPTVATGTIVCPSSGCAYSNFGLDVPPGMPGITVAGQVHGLAISGMMIADTGAGTSGACVDMTPGTDNQFLVIHDSTFIHCGAASPTTWCIDAGTTSDSSLTGTTTITNCGAGGLHIGFGYGWDIRPFRVEDQYGGPGVAWDAGGNGTIDVGGFDLNIYDIRLGSVYVTLGNVLDSRLAPGGVATFDIEGQAALVGGTVFTSGPTFYVNPSVASFYSCGAQIVGLSAADAYSTQIVGASVNTFC